MIICENLTSVENKWFTVPVGPALEYDAQFNYCVLVFNDNLLCEHVVRYWHRDQMSKIMNNGAQLRNAKLIKLLQYFHDKQ